ncbi:PAS domain S-box protein [Candidatus Neomarinimicrobiota bacterium]
MSIRKNNEMWIALSILLVITFVFVFSFPIVDSFQWSEILSESTYVFAILGGYFFITRYKIIILNVGWFIFALSIYFDLLDEFFVSTKFLMSTISNLFTPLGLLIVMVGLFKLVKITNRDKSERIKVNAALRKSENQYRNLVEKSGLAILVDDVNGNIKYCNKRFANLFGYTTTELKQIKIQSLIDPEDVEKVLNLHNDRMRGKKRQTDYELKGKRKDGSVINLEVHAQVMKEKGKITGTRSYINDITERKKKETLEHILYKISDAASVSKDLNQLYKAIHSHLSEILDTTNFYIALVDKEKALMHFPYFVDQVEYPPGPARFKKTISEYVLKSGKSVFLTEEDIQNLIDKNIVNSDVSGPISKVWLGTPLIIGNKSIGIICVQSYDNPNLYKKEDLEILDFVSTQIAVAIERHQIHELTKKSEKEYRRLSKELADSNSMKEILLDVISHDLKNPAGTLLGFSEILQEQNPENEIFFAMKQSSSDLLKVIDNANVLSKAAIGESIALEDLNLSQVLNGVIKGFEIRLKDSEIDLINEIDESLQIKANRIIDQIFINYISNAIQYAQHGKRIIIIRAKEESNFVSVEVIDFGDSIPKEKRKLIFERNVQLMNGKRKGRGLGLSIVKRIAQAHNAEIGVKPNKPTGNIFYIKIPS